MPPGARRPSSGGRLGAPAGELVALWIPLGRVPRIEVREVPGGGGELAVWEAGDVKRSLFETSSRAIDAADAIARRADESEAPTDPKPRDM